MKKLEPIGKAALDKWQKDLRLTAFDMFVFALFLSPVIAYVVSIVSRHCQ